MANCTDAKRRCFKRLVNQYVQITAFGITPYRTDPNTRATTATGFYTVGCRNAVTLQGA